MQFTVKSIATVTTVATVLLFTTPTAFAVMSAQGMSASGHTMMMGSSRNVMTMQKMLTRNMNSAVKNWQRADKSLNVRMAAQQAKGANVSAVQTAVSDLESQISTVQGLVGQVASATDIATLKGLQSQFQTARKAALSDVAAANKALAKNAAWVARVTAMQRTLTNNMNSAVKNWQRADKSLNARMAAKQAKGFNVSAAQAPIADLESQISTVQGLVGQVASTNDLTALKGLQSQFQTARKAALSDVAAANRALAKATK